MTENKKNESIELMRCNEFLKKVDRKSSRRYKEEQLRISKRISKMHPYEKLIDTNLNLHLRGMDYIQNVIFKADLNPSTEGSTKKTNRLMDTYDYEWTKKWVEIIKDELKIKFQLKESEPIRVMEFRKKYQITGARWKEILGAAPEIKENIFMAYPKGKTTKTKMLTPAACKKIFALFLDTEKIMVMSNWIAIHENQLNQDIIQKNIKIKWKNTHKNSKIKNV